MRSGRSGSTQVHLDQRNRHTTRLAVGFIATTALAVYAVAGCNIGDPKLSACEQNEALCPASARQSTDVACDCSCEAGYQGLTPTREFDGTISACLPPNLNVKLADPDQLATLNAMPQAEFNQQVFKFCSGTVADFLDNLIEEQQRPQDLAPICMGPRIRCSCKTSGAQGQTATCSQPCADKECDDKNCIPLLKVGGGVDMSGCSCSRVSSCGASTPAKAEPPLCMNRVAAVIRKKQNPN
jgi:hypothetical protein